MGQRDIIWTRVSKAGFAKGLRLKHYGEIIHAKFLSDYPAIVDKVQVTMITDRDEVEKRIVIARKVYNERNRRMESMTDEAVDTFYSCLLCQSFAPNHVCIITPERLGLCGAYNWLDGKAAYEIDNTGPNQPVIKGECVDPVRGIWKNINDYVFINSHKTIETFSAYSIMDHPMTSCGCFEVICGYVPECNGVMVVNREFTGDTPSGMIFSTLAGSVGGGQQTPGFMGCGKVFLTSRKFLKADGGFKRLVWMPKELKELLKEDLVKRFEEQGVPGLLDQIADETVATDAKQIRMHMEKVGHPALGMDDMSVSTQVAAKQEEVKPEPVKVEVKAEAHAEVRDKKTEITPELIEEITNKLTEKVRKDFKARVTEEIVKDIINTLSEKFLGLKAAVQSIPERPRPLPVKPSIKPAVSQGPRALDRIAGITAFNVKKDTGTIPVNTVTLGATREQGGTRGKVCQIGGATAMPFHLWEGVMPNKPLVAMEVFDVVGPKYPAVLREIYGDLLNHPADMAKACVEKYGAELISVRLEGTHPEKGDRTPDQAVELVKSVLAAVDVPLIITGHSSFDRCNEVMKAVAAACKGENLLLNWVESDNYRTIAGAALAYGHSVVAMSPIDVNIGKQLNILLSNMDVKPGQIVMDAMTGAMGYGIEYTYSVMERIRLTGLGGDAMLAFPIIVSPGQECAKIKELKSSEKEFPAWGELKKRAALWELTTATSLLYAGADVFIMYHPDAVQGLKNTIEQLMDGKGKA